MSGKQPTGPPPPPVVQRLRVRYAKRGRLRFTSHRDVARVIERGLMRARLPIGFSAGFSPHPKISYAGASPTGVASEAEYLEIGLAAECDPAQVRDALDAALPPGIDVVDVVLAEPGMPSLADTIEASLWRIDLPEVTDAAAATSLDLLLSLESASVQRATKDGWRTVDARAAVVHAGVAPRDDTTAEEAGSGLADPACARMNVVVRHLTPAVRPDDVLTALRSAAGLTTPVTPKVTRLAQGLLDTTVSGVEPRLIDPFDRISRPVAEAPAHTP